MGRFGASGSFLARLRPVVVEGASEDRFDVGVLVVGAAGARGGVIAVLVVAFAGFLVGDAVVLVAVVVLAGETGVFPLRPLGG